MEEQVILLQDFILETPAPNSEHKKQTQRLKDIVGGYERQIELLQAELQQERAKNEDS